MNISSNQFQNTCRSVVTSFHVRAFQLSTSQEVRLHAAITKGRLLGVKMLAPVFLHSFIDSMLFEVEQFSRDAIACINQDSAACTLSASALPAEITTTGQGAL